MKQRLRVAIIIILLLLLPSSLPFLANSAHAQSPTPQEQGTLLPPVSIELTPVPRQLPPGGTGVIIVQLVDANSNPSPARNASVTVSLFSSDPAVVNVSPQATIPFGKSHAEARMVTGLRGNVTITAIAGGFLSGSVQVSSSEFSDFALAFAPLENPVAPGDSLGLQVELQAAGRPFVTPVGVGVSIATSVSNISSQTVQIPAGRCCAYTSINIPASVNLTTTSSVVVTAAASGFISYEASVELSKPGNDSQVVLVNPYPESLMAGRRQLLSVALQDGKGEPTPGNFTVALFSSNSSVVSLPVSQVSFANNDSVTFPVYANTTGAAQITAMAPGLTPIPLSLTVVRPSVPALRIGLPAEVRVGESYSFSVGFSYEGRPIPSGPATVYLSSSVPGVDLPTSIRVSTLGYGIGTLSADASGKANVTAVMDGVPATTADVISRSAPLVAPVSYTVTALSDAGYLTGLPVNFTYANATSTVLTGRGGTASFSAYNDSATLVSVPPVASLGDETFYYFTGWSSGANADSVSLLASAPSYSVTAQYFESIVPTRYSLLALSSRNEPVTGLHFNVTSKTLGKNLTLTTGNDGEASFTVPNGTSFLVSVPQLHQTSGETHDEFVSMDNSTKRVANITSAGPMTINASYATYYQFQVGSPIGSTTGSGWYRSGSSASYSISETSSGGPLVFQRFTGWTGSFSSDKPNGSTIVSSQEYITAQWSVDNSLLFATAGGVIAAATVIGLFIFRLRKKAPPS